MPGPDGLESNGDSRRWKALRRGDPVVWREFVAVEASAIEAWFRRRGASKADAPDLTQRVLLKVWLGLRRFRPDGDRAFERWLRVVVRRTLLDHFRDTAGRPVARGGDDALREFHEAPAPAERLESTSTDQGAELGDLAMRLLSRVSSERTRRLIELTALQDLPVAEAARELGLDPDAARQAKSRALRGLRELLESSARIGVTVPRSTQ